MNIHTHFAMPNAVFTESGRVGSLYTARVRTAIFVGNARYQERLGENLRAVGFDATDDGRITAVPEHVREHFSKRTNEGKERARERAEHRGAVWTDLRPEAMAQWIKSSVQHPSQKQRKEGLANFASWAKQAASLGWQPRTFVAQGPPREPRLYTRRDITIGAPKALMDSLNRLRIESVRTFQRVMHRTQDRPAADTALTMKREDRGIARDMGRSTVDKTRDVARGYRNVPIRERREPRLTIPL
jgi:hypothetical protein